MSRNNTSTEPFYVYIYLNPLKPGQYTYGEFLSFEYEPFYVGKGYGNRLYKHLNETLEKTYNPFKVRLINKIKSHNLEPIIIKLNYNLKECKAFAFEKFYIKTIGRRGKKLGPLTNLTDGGEGVTGYAYSEEQNKMNSERITKYFENPLNRLKTSISTKKAMQKPEIKAKVEQGRERLKILFDTNEEFRTLHSENTKSGMNTTKTKEKMFLRDLKRWSDEEKLQEHKIRQKVNMNKPETKAKISERTKKAMWEPEKRKRYLLGIEKREKRRNIKKLIKLLNNFIITKL